MAITSEIIGKLGGGDVETVEIAGRDTNGSDLTIHTVEVADGEEVLAVFIGRFSKLPSLANNNATLSLGDSIVRVTTTSRDATVAAVITETSSVVLHGAANVNSSTLTGGTVYTVKM